MTSTLIDSISYHIVNMVWLICHPRSKQLIDIQKRSFAFDSLSSNCKQNIHSIKPYDIKNFKWKAWLLMALHMILFHYYWTSQLQDFLASIILNCIRSREFHLKFYRNTEKSKTAKTNVIWNFPGGISIGNFQG